ncbi:hypothetical protein [Amycolatopsis samaneae]|uniref:Uncharacterized protein n=1 Tax=Amycolatopsis samaneae TaxID=664691 RepID=A0ABW5GIF2_9PSEU
MDESDALGIDVYALDDRFGGSSTAVTMAPARRRWPSTETGTTSTRTHARAAVDVVSDRLAAVDQARGELSAAEELREAEKLRRGDAEAQPVRAGSAGSARAPGVVPAQ